MELGEVKKLYHDSRQPMSLGCISCPDKKYCGGLHSSSGYFDCLDFCECDNPEVCWNVCPNNVINFVERLNDIHGFDLNNIPRSKPLSYPQLPYIVPMLYHPSRRIKLLITKAVAVPLSILYGARTGVPRFYSKEELANYFGIDTSAKLIISGVDKDPTIENYWSHRRKTELPKWLYDLQPDLITVPNYSLVLSVPRQDNLYNIKRIGICWNELVSHGIPTSLHLNARTDDDWQRWTDFVAERDEIKSIAFEFATGGTASLRGQYYAQQLVKLARIVPRKLQIVVRGGYKYLDTIQGAFNEVVFIDSTSFIKTMKRRKLNWKLGDIGTWTRVKTAPKMPLDDLLDHNIKTFAKMVTCKNAPLDALKKWGIISETIY